MADRLVHPEDRPDPVARFRADLAGYLRGLPGSELADLLAGLPDTWPGHPDTEFMRRRSLREVVADRRAARAARRAGPPPGATLADRLGNRPVVTRPGKDPAGERPLGEALRGRTAERPGRAGGDGVRRLGLPTRARAARPGLAGLMAADER
jgi:hypothetical protein